MTSLMNAKERRARSRCQDILKEFGSILNHKELRQTVPSQVQSKKEAPKQALKAQDVLSAAGKKSKTVASKTIATKTVAVPKQVIKAQKKKQVSKALVAEVDPAHHLPQPSYNGADQGPQLQKTLESFIQQLSMLGDDIEDIESCFQESEDQKNLGSLSIACAMFSKILKAQLKAQLGEEAQHTADDQTISSFSFYRTASRIGILAPVEVFKGVRRLTGKTVAFVRRKGGNAPLQYAISGWEAAAVYKDRLLDNHLWANMVLDFCQLYNRPLPTSGWDTYHEVRFGLWEAGHVEKMLMLWFAMKRLSKQEKLAPKLRNLQKLRKIKPRAEAEIYLSEEACSECEKFRLALSGVTGIQYTFKVQPNLGIRQKKKTSDGDRLSPLYILNDKPAESEEEETALVSGPKTAGKKTSPKARVAIEAPKSKKRKARCDDDDDDDFCNQVAPKKKQLKADSSLSQRRSPRKSLALLATTPALPQTACEVRINVKKAVDLQQYKYRHANSSAQRFSNS